MDDRDDLQIRAEVLGKLADQLGEQLAVERKANDELRSLLRDAPAAFVPDARAPANVAPVATALAALAVGLSICAAAAASWSGMGAHGTCGARVVPIEVLAAVAPVSGVSVTPILTAIPVTPVPPVMASPAPRADGAEAGDAIAPAEPRACFEDVSTIAAP